MALLTVLTIALCALLLSPQDFSVESLQVLPFIRSEQSGSPRCDASLFRMRTTCGGSINSDNYDYDVETRQRNQLAQDLLQTAAKVGQVGMRTSEQNRQKLEELAFQLIPFSDPQPAHVPLNGTHTLIYSASEAGPPTGLIGPFVGHVTQTFVNETIYQNTVKLGSILQITIFATRQVINDDEIGVSFYEIHVRLFGKRILSRQVDVGNPGIWKQLFVGRVHVDDEDLLLRVMNTPKLFILIQKV